MNRAFLFAIATGLLGLIAFAIPPDAEAQVTRCTPDPVGPAGYTCYTTRPAAPAEDPADRMIRNMAPGCLSSSGALREMLLAFAQPGPGGDAASARNMMLVEQARKQKCAEAEEAARREALLQETIQAEARLRAEQTRLYREQEAARQRAAQEKAARDQWLGMVSQAVLEGRCSDAKEMALRQGRLDVADQVQRVCVPPAPVKAPSRSPSPAPKAKAPPAAAPPSASAPRTERSPRTAQGATRTPLQLAIAKAYAGDPEAQNSLGGMYVNGTYGAERDDAEAANWFREAADQGMPEAQYNLGMLFEVGQGVPKNPSRAAELYVKAADQGLPQAQLRLAYLYERGEGVPLDLRQAEIWKAKAKAPRPARLKK